MAVLIRKFTFSKYCGKVLQCFLYYHLYYFLLQRLHRIFCKRKRDNALPQFTETPKKQSA